MPSTIVGIDVGGTFTDFAILKDGQLTVYKLSSTPSNPSVAMLQGVAELKLENVSFVHGSTVATNTLLERKGARTALITTQGFEDVIEIGRQNRSKLYDLMLERPPTLVPEELRIGVNERVDYKGTLLTSPSPQELKQLFASLANAAIESVAVSFLFSFLNPLHEEMVQEILDDLPQKPFISISSKVLPEFREYERTATVVVNSYVGPLMARYLGELEDALGKDLRIMQSSGGSITISLGSQQPVRTILSGPAGGVVGAFYLAELAGYNNIITLDMGGTSTDVSLCPGTIKETTSSTLGDYPISVPMIEIHSVGAGGGSISRVDEGGALVVGPQSAGADPGPACYGKGNHVTVTDANLVLGRLQPQQFLGGRMTLDYERSEHLMANLAKEMGIGTEEAALGILRIVNANMERAIRVISLERGYDPRHFTLLSFGGAGSMHSCELAKELGIPRVLVPPHPGILSALGVAIADIVKDYSRTVMLQGEEVNRQRLEEGFNLLYNRAEEEMRDEGLTVENAITQRSMDVRYVGQSFELTVDYPSNSRAINKSISNRFHRAHRQRFGYSDVSEPVEIVNLRLKIVIPVEKPLPQPQEQSTTDPSQSKILEERVVFKEGPFSTPIYQRDQLRCGNVIRGPALVVQMDSTTVITPGWCGTVDPYSNLIIEPC